MNPHNSETSPPTLPSSDTAHPVIQSRENRVHRIRAYTMRRRTLLTIIAAVLVLLIAFIIREPLTKADRIHALEELGARIMARKAQTGRWPSRSETLLMNVYARTVSLKNTSYDPTRLLPDSPDDTVVAYTPYAHFYFITPGHAVLTLDGKVQWWSADRLNQALRERERRYNATH